MLNRQETTQYIYKIELWLRTRTYSTKSASAGSPSRSRARRNAHVIADGEYAVRESGGMGRKSRRNVIKTQEIEAMWSYRSGIIGGLSREGAGNVAAVSGRNGGGADEERERREGAG